jgi:hypothetical protein
VYLLVAGVAEEPMLTSTLDGLPREDKAARDGCSTPSTSNADRCPSWCSWFSVPKLMVNAYTCNFFLRSRHAVNSCTILLVHSVRDVLATATERMTTPSSRSDFATLGLSKGHLASPFGQGATLLGVLVAVARDAPGYLDPKALHHLRRKNFLTRWDSTPVTWPYVPSWLGPLHLVLLSLAGSQIHKGEIGQPTIGKVWGLGFSTDLFLGLRCFPFNVPGCKSQGHINAKTALQRCPLQLNIELPEGCLSCSKLFMWPFDVKLFSLHKGKIGLYRAYRAYRGGQGLFQ